MPRPPDVRQPVVNRRAEYTRADEAREKKRSENATEIDPAAKKWRYTPLRGSLKTPP